MDTIWARCMALLRTKLTDHAVSTWLEPIHCQEIAHDKVELSVPNNFFIVWIKDNYLKEIRDALAELTGATYEIDFKSRDEFIPDGSEDRQIETEKTDRGLSLHVSDELALTKNLNPRYTFESFVVGNCNRFAQAAALSVSENLGGSYNPLFIYGGVGLGKTHLMSAIGYAILSKDKNKKIYFTTSEEFTNEMIHSIRFDKTVDFRNKYRSVNLLMIDDIQFLAGKERTQEEFFHTFNSIYEARNQIVVTSDRFPGEIEDLDSRLKSRFSWGLIADMGAPDLETRVAILQRKAYEDSVDLPDDVAHFLADHVHSNVRELVGYLTRVIAMSALQGIPLTVDLARLALREILHRHSKAVTVDQIIARVSKAFNVKPADIKSRKKHKLYALPRQVGMYLARELTELSYPEIGVAFGGKDHSTVIYAARKIEKTLEQDHSLKTVVEGLRKEIRG